MSPSTSPPLVVLVTGLLLFGACGGPGALDARYGWTDDVGDLHPDIAIEVSPVVADGGMAIEVRALVPHAERRMPDDGELAAAPLRMHVHIRNTRESQPLADTTVQVGARSATTGSYGAVIFRSTPPGQYAVVTTLAGGDTPVVRRELAVAVPNPATGTALTPIRIAQGSGSAGIRLPAWVPGQPLSAAFDVVNARGESQAEFRVLRLLAHATAAEPPYWAPPAPGALTFRGVDLDPALADTVTVDRQRAADVLLSTITVELPPLQPGAYLLAARLTGEAGAAEGQRRPLGVLPAGYPADDLDARIGALAYIAYPVELEVLDGLLLDSERAALLDRFWRSLISDPGHAEATRDRFHDRIRRANRFFASHLPGWMTDRGMVYVVLGPPDHVERTAEVETWHYGDRDASAYVFERVDSSPFGQYVLRRAARYETEWRQAVDRWRRGG